MKILGAKRQWVKWPKIKYSSESNRGAVTSEGVLHLTDSDGNLKVFNVERNEDGRWLNGNNGHPDNVWNGNNRWAFRRNFLHFSRHWREFLLLVETSNPAAEHLADFLQDFRERQISFGRYGFYIFRQP